MSSFPSMYIIFICFCFSSHFAALFSAVENGHLEKARTILESTDVDVNRYSEFYPLLTAINFAKTFFSLLFLWFGAAWTAMAYRHWMWQFWATIDLLPKCYCKMALSKAPNVSTFLISIHHIPKISSRSSDILFSLNHHSLNAHTSCHHNLLTDLFLERM